MLIQMKLWIAPLRDELDRFRKIEDIDVDSSMTSFGRTVVREILATLEASRYPTNKHTIDIQVEFNKEKVHQNLIDVDLDVKSDVVDRNPFDFFRIQMLVYEVLNTTWQRIGDWIVTYRQLSGS